MLINNRLKIQPFEEKYTKAFYELNADWLRKYFYIEPYDELVLSNPKKEILDKGGFIFCALYNNEVIGVVSLINQKNYFELSKMAVSPEYQGLKIGQQLMDFTINFAKQQDWKSITLYSHRSLKAAMHLYKKSRV